MTLSFNHAAAARAKRWCSLFKDGIIQPDFPRGKTERQMFKISDTLTIMASEVSRCFSLTTKLACSNLIKNRKLCITAIAVILAVTIAYLLTPWPSNPISSFVGNPMIFTLVLGLFTWSMPRELSSCSMPIASSWKTLQGAGHLQHARSWETASHQHDLRGTLVFGFPNHLSRCVLIGALFDKLIFAFLLKLMKMKVSWYPPSNLGL